MRRFRLVLAAAAGLGLGSCGVPRPAHVELKAAPATGELAALVRGELARAARDRRKLLVYVGASWCKPCRRFHEAVEKGQLDATFPELRLYVLDNDRDKERLLAAGYTSQLIPLFARPGPDGRASGRQIEGSVKGEAAVAEIVPRLRALLE